MTYAYPGSDLATLSVGSLVWMASAQPVLDDRTEDELIELAREGDRQALEQLAMRNLRIVIDEAIRTRGLGASQGKLVRLGVGALVDAARYYDPTVHGRFSSHLRTTVRGAFQKTIRVS
jgi:DNA-directed RNA polymerase sigma subunit (sigma70/sigma32)